MDEADRSKPFHILALSGGGYRGLYTATVLSSLEKSLGRPLAKHFDLICGTSAGGLLALGLAAEIPASELEAMFANDGKRIFGARSLVRRVIGKWIVAKHSADGLRSVLTERLGSTTIGDLKHRVLVPAVNYSTGKGQFFKTPHMPAFETDYRRTLVDVGLATAAAPTYFPLHRIDGEGVFADGGLVGNSPGFFGLHEATKVLCVGEQTPVRVLSVGTMTLGATLRGSAGLDRGIFRWGSKVFDLVISAQESAVDSMLTHVLGDCYYRIDDLATPDQSRDVSSLDAVTAGATNVLRDRGAQAARRTLGDARFSVFKSHLAAAPTFYHGPNKSAGVVSC
ncbi:patatin [Paraburkholderia dipogonis]|uniref:Patatin n=1 Tax=Paraburkholderia dipogonis TaxID=1211383 RepID=A0A4Y8MIT7_9BURK|nr:CBASS cGAMP-activated phospholipase [Paraburkholderia dipogonis]TFE37345.1 patatin [Paraburkholderia dipogonis]